MVEPPRRKMSKWKQSGNKVEFFRCDDAGENKSLEMKDNGAEWNLNVQFEHTARATPQRDHLMEIGFQTSSTKVEL